jgi:dolichol-phosphate mannosyltransferase
MVYFILPAFNEEKNVRVQLEGIKTQMTGLEYCIVVVNDGSTDGTVREVTEYRKSAGVNIILIDSPRNNGVGTAFKMGFDKLIPIVHDHDKIITMDFDNTQSVKTIGMMLNRLEQGFEVVNGSVFTMGGRLIGVPFLRLVLAYACNLLYRFFFHIKGIHDYTGFFKAFTGAALKKLYEVYGDDVIESKGFAVMAEVLIKCRMIPLFITEVPMLVRYDIKKGRSKMRVSETISQHLVIITKYMFYKKHMERNIEG